MEVGAHVWLRTPTSQWGWVPARIVDREEITNDSPKNSDNQQEKKPRWGGIVKSKKKSNMVKITLRDDTSLSRSNSAASSNMGDGPLITPRNNSSNNGRMSIEMSNELNYFSNIPPFTTTVLVDSNTLSNADHPDIKLRNLPTSHQNSGGDPEAQVITSPSTHLDSSVVGGVHDLIGLTHLHEPAILHALRLRYDSNIIYTSTGPILIAINPFQSMEHLYCSEIMEEYRLQGEGISGSNIGSSVTPFKKGGNTPYKRGGAKSGVSGSKLPPHAYKTADDAYRAMKRGLENSMLMTTSASAVKKSKAGRGGGSGASSTPTNQSILVSGESGAGKTVTTKIVLNYFAMLSKQIQESDQLARSNSSPMVRSYSSKGKKQSPSSRMSNVSVPQDTEEVCIEQQVLQSNPILEAFGNARTLRNDNSSRFGKYIDIKFTPQGKLSGASIETYLLEKVRLIHPSLGERNYHIFYQFLEAASLQERDEFGLDSFDVNDFKLLNGTGGVYDRRDGVNDGDMHIEMLDAMVSTELPCLNFIIWPLSLTCS